MIRVSSITNENSTMHTDPGEGVLALFRHGQTRGQSRAKYYLKLGCLANNKCRKEEYIVVELSDCIIVSGYSDGELLLTRIHKILSINFFKIIPPLFHIVLNPLQ